MADLVQRVSFSLTETRLLMLGAEMGLGFQFEIPFQEGFDALAPGVRLCHLLALAGMLLATVLVIIPMMTDLIVYRGQASSTTQGWATLAVEAALVPFGASLGASLAGCAWQTAGPVGSCLLGAGFALGSGAAWHVWPSVCRLRTKGRRRQLSFPPPMKRAVETPLHVRMRDILTEARIILPGVQAMLGFSMVTFLTKAFARLPASLRWIHLGSAVLLLATVVLLMAPPAFHRIVEEGEETERLHRFSQRMVFLAAIPFGLSIAGDLFVAIEMVSHRPAAAALGAGALLLLCAGCWYALPYGLGRAGNDSRD